MATLHGFPFFRLEFTKTGKLHIPSQEGELLSFLQQATTSAEPITDLLVLAHGWNNDMAEATQRYDCLLEQLHPLVLAGRRFAAVGLFWPSKKFADRELTAGGGAAFVGTADEAPLLLAELEGLRGQFDAPDADAKLARAAELVPLLEHQQSARTEFADLIKALLAGIGSPDDDPAGATVVQNTDSAQLVAQAGEPLPASLMPADVSGTNGGAAGLDDMFSGILGGARNLLNFTTYYEMKERAGLVGRQGLRPVLAQLAQQFPHLRLHAIGHSFGGRLLTSAASGQHDFRLGTLTLLQTAFSHYGFSKDYDGQDSPGLFRPLITDHTVTGPVLISHAEADFALRRLYALASRLAGQIAAFVGGPDDKYGSLGANGAQKTPEATFGALLPVSGTYTFQANRLYNLHGNTVLQGKAIISGHGDICGPEIAATVMQAIATT